MSEIDMPAASCGQCMPVSTWPKRFDINYNCVFWCFWRNFLEMDVHAASVDLVNFWLAAIALVFSVFLEELA